jgi:hypothetical protein
MGVRHGAARAIFACFALAWCVPALADTTDVETSYQLAAERVHKHATDIWLDGTPQGERALDHAWRLLADWTASYLNEHPGATPKRLKRAAPGGDLDVVPLGTRTMLVSAQVDGFGTIFIVDGTDGPFRPAWSIRRHAGREAFPLLEAWTAKAARQNCRDPDGDAGWRCGPINGTAKRLPDDAQGRPRFYVDADYPELAGMTEGSQLSFWTWTGKNAEPQFVTSYLFNIDGGGPTNIDDGRPTQRKGDALDVVKVRVAENYRMIAPWWDHLDRELDWVFRVGPDRIVDLGKKPVIPEMDVVDEVLLRAAHRVSADDIATPEVQARVAQIVGRDRDGSGNGEPSLGMTGGFTIHHQDGRSLVCLPADEVGALTFTLIGSFVSDLTVAPNDSGDGCRHAMP